MNCETKESPVPKAFGRVRRNSLLFLSLPKTACSYRWPSHRVVSCLSCPGCSVRAAAGRWVSRSTAPLAVPANRGASPDCQAPVLKWCCLCSVLLGAVTLLICRFTNDSHVVQGSNLKQSCCVKHFYNRYRLRTWVCGLQYQTSYQKKLLQPGGDLQLSLMLNLLYVHYVADLHVNGTPDTLDLQHPCRGLYITCTERKATALWGMWALGTLPCCGQGLWNSYSWCVAAVSWALGWVLSWAVLPSFILSFWWSIQRLWLRARSSWFLN